MSDEDARWQKLSRSRSRSRSTDRHRPKRLPKVDDSITRDERARGKEHRVRTGYDQRKRRSRSPGSDFRSSRDWERRKSRDKSEDWSKERPPRRYRSPPQAQHSPAPFRKSNGPLLSQQEAFEDGDKTVVKRSPQPEKQKPNFGPTGKLAAASNTIQATGGQTVVLKYHEPAEARKPSARDRWRMYVFKGNEILDTVELSEQSCWLFGRESAVVDFCIEHPSSSKQHAVIQFRYVEKRNEFGDKIGKVKPYIIDLESANGTSVNEEKVPDGRYVELKDKDVVKFGYSSREYVIQLPPAG